MGVTIARVVKEYKESISVSYNDSDGIIEFLSKIDSEEYPIEFTEKDYYMEFIASEFNRYCEEKGVNNLPCAVKWLYENITKPANLDEGEYVELEWW